MIENNNICEICEKPIKMAIFKNTGVCSELHRKERKRRQKEKANA